MLHTRMKQCLSCEPSRVKPPDSRATEYPGPAVGREVGRSVLQPPGGERQKDTRFLVTSFELVHGTWPEVIFPLYFSVKHASKFFVFKPHDLSFLSLAV